MSRATLKRLGLLAVSFGVVAGVFLYRDFLCYQRIQASITQITPTLLGNGMPQSQVDAIIFLLRNIATELRALITSGFIFFAVISILILLPMKIPRRSNDDQ